jgi:tetratricopeptide (TPR) repeat protein
MKIAHDNPPTKWSRLVVLVLALVTVLLYLPVRTHDFVLVDDPDYLTDNPMVKAGLTPAGVVWAFTTWHADNWHPLTWLSLMLDCECFGLNPGPHHVMSVLFHTANGVLLFVVLLQMTRALWPSAFVAALFAWHPLHVESVAWAAERKDVLSTFFGLLTIWAYVQYVLRRSLPRDPRPKADRPNRIAPAGTGYFWLAWIFFALGLLAKPMLVTLPFLLLLLEYWPLQRTSDRTREDPELSILARRILEKWPFFALSAGSCVITFLAQREKAVASLAQIPFGFRCGNALIAYVRYLCKAIWPTDLAVFYPLPDRLPEWQLAGAAVLLVSISVLAWIRRGPNPYLLIGWLWFLGTLIPVLGLVQVGSQAMADRYTYFSLIGIFMAVAFGFPAVAARIRPGSGWVFAPAGAILVACLFLSSQQLNYWKDSESLFAHAVNVTANNAMAHFDLGMTYELNGLPEKALAEYREALHVAELHPHAADTLMTPEQKAIAHFNLGARCEHYGDVGGAVAEYRAALQWNPDHVESLTRLAQVLASHPDDHVRNGPEAVRLAEQANRLTRGEDPVVLDALAMTYAETGRFPEAGQVVDHAIALATAADRKDLVAVLQSRRDLYHSGQPYRSAIVLQEHP